MKLKNKIVLVTGSSLGIGRGIAIALAKEGADIIVNYNKSKEQAENVADLIRGMGRQCISIKADVGIVQEIEDMFHAIRKEFNGLDILVNNAGISAYAPFFKITEEIWDKTLSVNLKAAFFCSQFAAKEMINRGGGKIVNIASCGAILGFRNLSHYCASKGGLVALTRQMAGELAKYHINVNCIGPGVIVTKRREEFWTKEETKKPWERVIPLGRFGAVDDVLGAVVFVCSEDSAYMTGQTFFVDGGWSAEANWPGGEPGSDLL
ncbi:3-oxoacyl-ACP reductase FabG [Candidatus Peregrinibacteria bacterium]|nr:3-oxoacyl-ACP reductase FabG [Candidatus Peregrinibacteria bacterium]